MGGIEDDIQNPDGRGRHSETLTKEEKKRGRYSPEKQRSEKLNTVSSQLGGRNMEATKEDQRGHEMINVITDLSH